MLIIQVNDFVKRSRKPTSNSWFATRAKVIDIDAETNQILVRADHDKVSKGDEIAIAGYSSGLSLAYGTSIVANATYHKNQKSTQYPDQVWLDEIRPYASDAHGIETIIESRLGGAMDSMQRDEVSRAIWDAFGKNYVRRMGYLRFAPTEDEPKSVTAFRERLASEFDFDEETVQSVATALCPSGDTDVIRMTLPSLSLARARSVAKAIHESIHQMMVDGCEMDFSSCNGWAKLAVHKPWEAFACIWQYLSTKDACMLDDAIVHDIDGVDVADEKRISVLLELCFSAWLEDKNGDTCLAYGDGAGTSNLAKMYQERVAGQLSVPWMGFEFTFDDFVQALGKRCVVRTAADDRDPYADLHEKTFVIEPAGPLPGLGESHMWLSNTWRNQAFVAKCLAACDSEWVTIFGERLDELLDALMTEYERLRTRSKRDTNIHAAEYRFDDSQKNAIRVAIKSRVSIVCGGPGCGKTDVADAIAWIHEQLCEKADTLECGAGLTQAFAVAGKACSILRSKTDALAIGSNKEAMFPPKGPDRFTSVMTIASMLRRSSPLDARASMFIVDESSMLTLHDMAHVMNLIMNRNNRPHVHDCTQLVLVGDEDQLPAIGAGSVLADAVASGVCRMARLTTSHRQGSAARGLAKMMRLLREGSDEDALRVLWDATRHPGDFGDSMHWHVLGSNGLESVVDAFCQRLHSNHDDDARQMMLLTPKVDTARSLNASVQRRVNPSGQVVAVSRDGTEWRVNDRILCLKNDTDGEYGLFRIGYDGERLVDGRRLVNGDLCNVVETYEDGKGVRHVIIELDASYEGHHYRADVPAEMLANQDTWSHGWAMTIHKAQGSEAECVMFVTASGMNPKFYTRQLVYTALTRAKSDLWVFCDNNFLHYMFKNRASRHTELSNWLTQAAS